MPYPVQYCGKMDKPCHGQKKLPYLCCRLPALTGWETALHMKYDIFYKHPQASLEGKPETGMLTQDNTYHTPTWNLKPFISLRSLEV